QRLSAGERDKLAGLFPWIRNWTHLRRPERNEGEPESLLTIEEDLDAFTSDLGLDSETTDWLRDLLDDVGDEDDDEGDEDLDLDGGWPGEPPDGRPATIRQEAVGHPEHLPRDGRLAWTATPSTTRSRRQHEGGTIAARPPWEA